MSHRLSSVIALAFAVGAPSPSLAQQTMPNEFETPTSALSPLFSFFGGVNGFGAEFDPAAMIHSGASLRIYANFQPDTFFTTAGFAIGANNMSGANLAAEALADTFSITVEAPVEGVLSFFVTVREDDNGDGVASATSNDDQWESPDVFLTEGVSVYNIPASAFILVNEGTGNDTQNFTTSGVMSVFITFESKESYPGGIIEVPVSFHADHLGFYVGAQTLPDASPPADLNGDGIVNGADLAALLAAWGSGGPADLNSDGAVDGADLASLLASWG